MMIITVPMEVCHQNKVIYKKDLNISTKVHQLALSFQHKLKIVDLMTLLMRNRTSKKQIVWLIATNFAVAYVISKTNFRLFCSLL